MRLGERMNKSVFTKTIIISAVFFVVLFIVSYLASIAPSDGGIKIEPIYVFIALIPFIVLLIASGKLKEIKGPGGIALLMKDEAEREISVDVEDNAIEIDSEIVHSKGGIESLTFMLRESPPTALSFVLEKKDYYAQYAIEGYINELRKLSSFKNIVFVSNDGSFLAYMKVEDFSQVVKESQIVDLLESGDILKDKRTNPASINIDSTNRDTLSEMEKCNVNELAVIDSKSKFLGVINQEQIVRKVLSRLVREA